MEGAYTCCAASPEMLARIWDRDIRQSGNSPKVIAWKDEFIENNRAGRCKTYMVLYDGEPVGQGTLLLSPACGGVHGRLALADGEAIANINALRIDKAHEGRGHISRLVRLMERDAKAMGFRALTIGVEAREARNLAIYLHWGYDRLVLHEVEDGELVLYYEKTL